jgi:hypothetical protein
MVFAGMEGVACCAVGLLRRLRSGPGGAASLPRGVPDMRTGMRVQRISQLTNVVLASLGLGNAQHGAVCGNNEVPGVAHTHTHTHKSDSSSGTSPCWNNNTATLGGTPSQ